MAHAYRVDMTKAYSVDITKADRVDMTNGYSGITHVYKVAWLVHIVDDVC